MAVKQYRANWLYESKRPKGGFSNSTHFAATDATAAAAIAAVLEDATTAQMGSLQERYFQSGEYNTNHPEGTRITANAVTISTLGAVWRARVRNVKDAPGAEAAFAALLKGEAFSDDDFDIAAVTGGVGQANSHENIATAQVAIITKT